MRNSLDARTPDGRTVADIVFAPLDSAKIEPAVVDVGARNGTFFLPESYARRAHLYGFEPNPEEYRKLIAGDTDAMKAGMVMPKFGAVSYYDCAVWDGEEERPFYVTGGPGACTMMGEPVPEVAGRLVQVYAPGDPRFGHSFAEMNGRVQKTLPVKCRPLDHVLPAGLVVDYLKIDTEGAELRVLKGADALLSEHRVLFIYTEFVALPYYREHPVLGDLQVYLRDRGYRMIDIELGHRGYTRGPTTLPALSDRHLLHSGDAMFVLDPDRTGLSSETRQRLAAIALAYEYNSFAISLLREAELNSEAEIAAVTEALSQPPLARRLGRAWKALPYAVYSRLQRLRAALR
ncbi:MAG: FkbM family methyltransferase [Proteobacteria bacterium]|nr:FkbM family methyltransferase [Pseudomonadota bacterium]